MALPQFFLENQVLDAEESPVFPLRLSDDDLHHARVLRLERGQHVAVVDAASDYFECEVASFDAGGLFVSISQRGDVGEDGPSVMLVQGLAKGDKMDTVVRHGTEVGVDVFVPLACERSVVKLDAKKAVARAERWRSIARSAAMQSGRRHVPEVSEPVGLDRACELLRNATAVIVCYEEADGSQSITRALSSALTKLRMPAADARVAVVVGPEGGLTSREVQCLLDCNPRAYSCTLGPSILRTETAGVVAPALVLHDLRNLSGGLS